MPKPKTSALVKALKKAVPIFVNAGGWPRVDTSKPYILLTEEKRDEIVAALTAKK